MNTRAQGLPITTVVIIVLSVAVLAIVTIFFLSGTASGQASVSTFQCQQQCQTANTLIQGKQICSTDSNVLKTIGTLKSFCSSGCATKTACALPNINNGCGYDRTDPTIQPTCLSCNPITGGDPIIKKCS